MRLGRYQLSAQIGAGRDGVAYRARSRGGREPLEIQELEGRARTPAAGPGWPRGCASPPS